MDGKIKYEFSAKSWQHSAPNGWHFVSLPTEISAEIRKNLKWQEEGWGRLKATAEIVNGKLLFGLTQNIKHTCFH